MRTVLAICLLIGCAAIARARRKSSSYPLYRSPNQKQADYFRSQARRRYVAPTVTIRQPGWYGYGYGVPYDYRYGGPYGYYGRYGGQDIRFIRFIRPDRSAVARHPVSVSDSLEVVAKATIRNSNDCSYIPRHVLSRGPATLSDRGR